MLLPTLLSFAVGIGAILIASRIFLSLSQELSARWRLSPLFIAVVVLALATSLPELTVTIAAIAQHDPGIALGNTIGSSITNLTLIFGLTTLFGVVTIGTKKTQMTGLLMVAIMIFFGLTYVLDLPNFTKGVLLLGALAVGLSYEFLIAVKGRLHEDKSFLKKLAHHRKNPKYVGSIGLLAIVLSIAGLAAGGMLVVKSVQQLSIVLGTSTTLLGLALNSLATTVPELSMAITASAKRENKIVIGTLVGSNIFNLTLFPALIYLFSGQGTLPMPQLMLLGVATVLFTLLLFAYRGKIVPLTASLLLISVYVVFAITNLQAITQP